MRTNISFMAAGVLATLVAMTNLSSAEEAVVETTSTTSAGTVTEFSPNTIVIRSETSPEPVHYVYRKTTTYVDDAGNPVSMEVVKSGLPVTVHYIKEGERLIASRVIVHHRVVPVAPPIIEERTTTTTTTTTTTNK